MDFPTCILKHNSIKLEKLIFLLRTSCTLNVDKLEM